MARILRPFRPLSRRSRLALATCALLAARDLATGSEPDGDRKSSLALPPPCSEESSSSRVVFYGQQLEGDGICYVLDTTRALTATGARGLERTKAEFRRSIAILTPGSCFAIIVLGSGIQRFPFHGGPVPARADLKDLATAWVDGLGSGCRTNDRDVAREVQRLTRQSTTRRLVVVFTGGARQRAFAADRARRGDCGAVRGRPGIAAVEEVNRRRDGDAHAAERQSGRPASSSPDLVSTETN